VSKSDSDSVMVDSTHVVRDCDDDTVLIDFLCHVNDRSMKELSKCWNTHALQILMDFEKTCVGFLLMGYRSKIPIALSLYSRMEQNVKYIVRQKKIKNSRC
jgi:hypothetical protein